MQKPGAEAGWVCLRKSRGHVFLKPIEPGDGSLSSPVMEEQRVMMGDSLPPSMGRWSLSLWPRRLGAPLPPSLSLPACLHRSLPGWWGAQPCCRCPRFWIGHLSLGATGFLELGTSSPLSSAPLSGIDRCEELAVGTNAVTGTGTKEEDRV